MIGPRAVERRAVPAPVGHVVHGIAQIAQLAAQFAQQNHGAKDAQRRHGQHDHRADERQASRLRGDVVVEVVARIPKGQGAHVSAQVVPQRHADHSGVAFQIGPHFLTAAGAPGSDPFLGHEVAHEARVGAEENDAGVVEDLDGEYLLVGAQVLFQLLRHALQLRERETQIHLGLDALADVVELELEPRGEEIGQRALEHVSAQHGGHAHTRRQDDDQRQRDACRQSQGHSGTRPPIDISASS